MKGTLKVKDDTVTIEEFSYPLEQFLIDEPDFKAPKADQLVYRRGEGTLLYIGDDTKKDEKTYPSEMMEIFIARKKSYRGAFKARRNATAQGRNWRDDIEQDTPKNADTDPAEEKSTENEGNAGDGDTPDQDNQPDGTGTAEEIKEPQVPDLKPDTKDKKVKSGKQKETV